ncbi:hypothetical protein K2173_022534 [Erythroxylum novogranatense]|uniref:Uncharacterized protein n=1 Tax=Erythroxylum novogranatense TaxID=1862640 RepID=A0AAV8TJL9_9ROSI|nr:hypothetical protein K2173_022534 [Erythroxylum novogranatense]
MAEPIVLRRPGYIVPVSLQVPSAPYMVQLVYICLFVKNGTEDGHDGEDAKQSTADMTAFVQNLLQQMQSRFQTMSDSIITKNILFFRIDELEHSITDLKAEIGGEGSPSPSLPPKAKEEAKSPGTGSA